MVRHPPDPRPGLGPVHPARRPRHADGPRRSRQQQKPATGPRPHRPQPRKVRAARAPASELAATPKTPTAPAGKRLAQPHPPGMASAVLHGTGRGRRRIDRSSRPAGATSHIGVAPQDTALDPNHDWDVAAAPAGADGMTRPVKPDASAVGWPRWMSSYLALAIRRGQPPISGAAGPVQLDGSGAA